MNRVWANYFGIGIINPPDDSNLANPPSNAPLLHYLTEGFIKSGYDMKWLHREIANSETYQRGWQVTETNKHDERNFSRALVRRLPAEALIDAVKQATASGPLLAKMTHRPVGSNLRPGGHGQLSAGVGRIMRLASLAGRPVIPIATVADRTSPTCSSPSTCKMIRMSPEHLTAMMAGSPSFRSSSVASPPRVRTNTSKLKSRVEAIESRLRKEGNSDAMTRKNG